MRWPGEATDTSPLEGGWWSPAARRLHLVLVVGLSICLAAGWFELTRALAGREIAWVYAGEWPLYGVLGTYLWWKLLHPRTGESAASLAAGEPVAEGATNKVEAFTDAELKAWQDYLQALHEVDPPGGPPPRR